MSVEKYDPTASNYLESMLTHVVKSAIEGKLEDGERVLLLRLALTCCAEEFHSIAANGNQASVKPEILLLIQQIYLICEDEVDPEKLMGAMGIEIRKGTNNVDSSEERTDSVEDAG